MKLQIKDSGAWRNLASFTPADEPEVRAAASQLLRAIQQPKTTLRIAEGDTPLRYCAAPDFEWRDA